MSTTRSLTIGMLPIAEMIGTRPSLTSSYMRVLQASTAAPSMRMPQEPQIIMRQLLRYASVPSWRSLIRSRTSRSVASSGASISYSFSARSPVDESYRQILSPTCMCLACRNRQGAGGGGVRAGLRRQGHRHGVSEAGERRSGRHLRAARGGDDAAHAVDVAVASDPDVVDARGRRPGGVG